MSRDIIDRIMSRDHEGVIIGEKDAGTNKGSCHIERSAGVSCYNCPILFGIIQYVSLAALSLSFATPRLISFIQYSSLVLTEDARNCFEDAVHASLDVYCRSVSKTYKTYKIDVRWLLLEQG